MMRALLAVGGRCNNGCTFCNAQGPRGGWSTAEVSRLLAEAADTGCTSVVFAGGEPTMAPELERWAEVAAARGLRTGLMTNGRLLAAGGLLERLVDRGLETVWVGLHGPAAVHDRLTRAPAFAQTFAAVRRLARSGVGLVVTTAVTRANLGFLREVVNLVAPLRRVIWQLELGHPASPAAPPLAAAAAAIQGALNYARARATTAGPGLAHAGVPLCLLPGFEAEATDLAEQGFVVVATAPGVGWSPPVLKERRFAAACGSCALRARCPGVPPVALAHEAAPALRPAAPRPCANSFTYERVLGLGAPTEHGGCPAGGSRGLLRARDRALLVEDAGRISVCVTTTRDFPGDAIAATKHELQQLYLDVSGKPAPDDFPADLRPLRPVRACVTCPERPTCCGCYAEADEDVFTRDDAPVRAIVSALRGRVLDAGCGGTARYADLLAPLVATRAVRYLGLDPDVGAVAAIAATGWAEAAHGTLEGFAAAPGSFDVVLLLRAFNHLTDAAAAMRVAAHILRPGGELIVADNVAFGLVRLWPLAPAPCPPPGLEHYRNVTSHEALEVIVPCGFRVLAHIPVAAGRSDQWLVRCERATQAPS